MKKHIAKILLFVLMFNLVPFSEGALSAFASEELPDIIYISDDYEDQVTGKFASGFYQYVPKIFVEKAPREGEPDNQAILFKNPEGATSPLSETLPVAYAPIWEDFVFEFKYMVGTNTTTARVKMGRNNVDRHQGYNHMEVTNAIEILEIGGSLKVNGKTITKNEVGKWYKLTLKVNAKSKNAEVYVDGESKGSVSLPSFENVSGFIFEAPRVGNDADHWFVDDINIYLSDHVFTDEELAAKLAEFEESGLALPKRLRTGAFGRERYFIFEALRDEFIMCTYGRRAYRDNKFHSFPVNNYTNDDGCIYVPLRAFSEMMGATVGYDDGIITVDYKGKNLRFVVGSNVYHVNNRASEMIYPLENKNGSTTINLDVLTNLFGVKYEIIADNIISFTGEIKSKRRLAPGLTSLSLLDDNIIRDIRIALAFEQPSPEEVLALYRERNPEGSHEKLLTAFYSFDDLRAMYADGNGSEPLFNKAVKTFIDSADKEIDNPTGYGKADAVAFAWQMTKDPKYIETINKEVDLLYDQMYEYSTKNWHDKNSNPLQYGNIQRYIARVYDWAYDVLTEESIQKIMDITERYTFPYYEQSFCSQRRVGSFAGITNPEAANNVSWIAKGGAIETCIALMDLYPKRASELLSAVIAKCGYEANTFYPSGYWGEGMSYWNMTMPYYAEHLMSIEGAFGTTFGLTDVGLLKTSNYGFSLQGTTGSAYIFGDGNAQSPYATWLMYEAKKSGNEALAQTRRENFGGPNWADIFAWCPPKKDSKVAERETDSFIDGGGREVLLRSGWGTGDACVAIHGGSVTGDGHGHEDVGDIQFDMLGYRWGTAIAKESYNLRGYGFYGTRDGFPPTGYNGRDYYRDNAEGHNVVIANMGASRNLMPSVGVGQSEFFNMQFGKTMSFAMLDVTNTNVIYEKGIRGIKLDKIQNEITIRDEFKAKEETDFWWFMHTEAEVEVLEDGKSAILSTNNGAKRIWAGLLTEGDEKFQVMEAKAMPGFKTHQDYKGEETKPKDKEYMKRPDVTEDIIIRPPLETPNDGTQDSKITIGNVGTQKKPIRKLAVHATNTDRFEISVVFKPLVGDSTTPLIMPTASALKDWKINNSVKVGALSGVTVDGEPLKGFDPTVKNYGLLTVTEKSPVPKVEVTADSKYDVEVIEAKSVPSVTNVVLREKGEVSAIYNFTINPINNTEVFHSDRQIPIVAYTFDAEYDESTGPEAMFDGDIATNLATNTVGGSMTMDLGEVKKVSEFMASYLNGLTRKEHIAYEVSVDGENFTRVFDDWNSGTTNELETFSLGGVHDARYVRIVFYGNSKSLWTSISEFVLLEHK